jgi:hypothetical protein
MNNSASVQQRDIKIWSQRQQREVRVRLAYCVRQERGCMIYQLVKREEVR